MLIRKVVEYAKYLPVGKRGISTNRAHTMYNPPELLKYIKEANERMKIYAQIETKLGFDNIDDILNTEGVDGIFIGPNDLAADLNCIGDKNIILSYLEKAGTAAKKAGKPWGIITTDKEFTEHSKKYGLGMISYGNEINMLKNESKRIKEMLQW